MAVALIPASLLRLAPQSTCRVFHRQPSPQPSPAGRGRLDSRFRGNDDFAMVSFPGNDDTLCRLHLPLVGLG